MFSCMFFYCFFTFATDSSQSLRRLHLVDLQETVFSIEDGNFTAARTGLYLLGEDGLIDVIEMLFNRKRVTGVKVLDFLDTLPSYEETIRGYRFVQNEIRKDSEVYMTTVIPLLYRIKYLLTQNRFGSNTNIYQNLNHIYNRFPKGLQSFRFKNGTIRISSASNGAPLCGLIENFEYDHQDVIRVSTDSNHCDSEWEIQFFNHFRRFKLKLLSFYLYVNVDNILSLTSDDHVAETFWSLEPVTNSSSFRIKSLARDRYLIAESTTDLSSPHENVVSLSADTSHKKCKSSICRWEMLFN